jgi:hypothetical protein
MPVTTEFSAEVILARERADRERHKQWAAQMMQSEYCKYIIRGSKGDLLGGHAGHHKDPYNRDFQSNLRARDISKGQMPCEFVTRHERTPWEQRGHLRCFRIEGHFGMHCDEYGGRFRSSVLDIDAFSYGGRWPVRTEPFPGQPRGSAE